MIGVNTYLCRGIDVGVLLPIIKNVGYDHITMQHTGLFEDERTVRICGELGLKIPFIHASKVWPEIYSDYIKEATTAMSDFKRQLEQINSLGIKDVVVHHWVGEEYDETGLKAIEEISKFLKERRMNLLIENGSDGTRRTDFILGNTGHLKNVNFCFDLGHFINSDKTINLPVKYAERLKFLHLHDNKGEEDLHLGLGEGITNVKKLAGVLSKGKTMWYTAELRGVQKENLTGTLKRNYRVLRRLQNYTSEERMKPQIKDTRDFE